MPAYPICIRCLKSESEVDLVGVCSTCRSRGSGKETPASPRPSPVPDVPIFPTTQSHGEPSTATLASASRTVTDTERPRESTNGHAVPTYRFKNYDNVTYLDHGGMGFVYTAVHTPTKRTVALKTMSHKGRYDSNQLRRFRTEGQALARLSHPGIVQIFDIDEDDNVPYISMEFVAGGSLASRLKQGPAISPRESAEIMVEVASSLAAAHDQKIVHRDIKPSNILLTPAGKPKLTDFGLAAFLDATMRETRTEAMIGTAAYMSPEQASRKSKEAGPLSDVYSTGATLYEMLTGRPPFIGKNPIDVADKVCREAVVRPRAINKAVPADLETITLRCLEKDPRDRYPSAAALATDLTRHLRGEPIVPRTRLQKVKRVVRKNRVALASLLLIALFASLAFAFMPEDPAIAIERKLKRGESVTLVGERGLPRYWTRIFGDANLSIRDFPGGDGATWFDANNTTCFDLCRDTIADRYILEAELQHVDQREWETRVGIYLRGPEQKGVIRWTALLFSDCPVAQVPPPNQLPPAALKIAQKAASLGLRVSDRLTVTEEHVFHVPAQDLAFHQFPAAAAKANPWRKIKIEVSPQGLTGLWEVNGLLEQVMSVSTNQLAKSQNLMQVNLDMAQPGRTVPQWEPRGTVGVFAERGTLAVKNVRLVPDKP